MDFVIVLAVLALVVVFVSAPFRRTPAVEGAASTGARAAATDTEVAELEAAREAKYREIRDAELDHRTGKLSDADYEALDGALRAEAIEILRRLDTITGR
jgi:Flp pilus assembly protein TadG